MAYIKKQVCDPIKYKGREITVHEHQPDVMVRKDGSDFGVFTNAEAGRVAAMHSIDEEEKRK